MRMHVCFKASEPLCPRMYSSTFSDWFSQAVIDFMLGYRTLSVFSEFLEKLQSTDPRDRIRMDRIRTEAIADSVSRVLQEGERLLSGWTLLSPSELNTRLSDRLEEKILLLVGNERLISFISIGLTFCRARMRSTSSAMTTRLKKL